MIHVCATVLGGRTYDVSVERAGDRLLPAEPPERARPEVVLRLSTPGESDLFTVFWRVRNIGWITSRHLDELTWSEYDRDPASVAHLLGFTGLAGPGTTDVLEGLRVRSSELALSAESGESGRAGDH